jgi:nucleotide-binding universal stress UspA family protein
MENTMLNHILVPLDGSSLAECVLPHVLALAPAMDARLTLLHALELPRESKEGLAIDPVDWQLKKRRAESYLNGIADRLQNAGLNVESVIVEGLSAECIVDFAHNNDIDLIALSTHGRSGLSGWNVSSVVQKIILRSYKSILLVRAYKVIDTIEKLSYHRLFVGLDGSTRAEFILPMATNLAKFYNAELILGTVICRPEIVNRFPISEEDTELITRIAERNFKATSHYYKQLQTQLSLQGINLQTRMVINDNMSDALHEMVEEVDADLVMLVAHGRSGSGRFTYGSVATSFIAYGTTSLIIMQDLSSDEVKHSQAEIITREIKGH